jgi:hypothetical protein
MHDQATANGSIASGGEGFRLDGSGNRLVGNDSVNNQDEGYRIRDGRSNALVGSRAQGNGASDGEAGIRVQGSSNQLRRNASLDNAGDGILVTEGARDNLIHRNRALGNDGTDVVDQNLDPPCDKNEWRRNRFETASQDCIE